MKLTEIKSDLIGERMLTARMDNGLTLLIIPKKTQSFYAVYGARVGSIDRSFRLPGEDDFVDLPDGIAHFLEHKMFECESGDALMTLSQMGANANAFTSFDRTCYLFSCTENFYEKLAVLLDFVQEPYYTKETVDKEQGIIGQEIRMYADHPGWAIGQNLREALYRDNPVRVDIAGSVESIARITPELLYRCYDAFYNPANMVLAICGDVDPEEAAAFVEPRIRPVEPRAVEHRPFCEPKEAQRRFVEREMPVSKPMIEIGWKCPFTDDPAENIRLQAVGEVILEALFGQSSRFYCDHYAAGDFSDLSTSVRLGRGYCMALVYAETDDPARMETLVRDAVEQVKQNGLPADDFEIARRVLYGDEVRLFDSVEDIADEALATAMLGVGLFDRLDVLRTMTQSDCVAAAKELFEDAASAVSVVRPVSKEKEVLS